MDKILSIIDCFEPLIPMSLYGKQLNLPFEHENSLNEKYTKVAAFSFCEDYTYLIYHYKHSFITTDSNSEVHRVFDEFSLIIEDMNNTIGNDRLPIDNTSCRWWKYLPNWVFMTPEFIDNNFIKSFREYFLESINGYDLYSDFSEQEIDAVMNWYSKLRLRY